MLTACDRCRADLPDFARACPKCGDPVPIERPSLRVRLEHVPPPPRPTRPAWVAPAAVIVIAAAAGVAAFLLP